MDALKTPPPAQQASLPARLSLFTHLGLGAAQLRPQLGDLQLQVPDLGLQLKNPADGRQCHAFAGEPDHVLHGDDLSPGVTPLPTIRTRWPHDTELVEAPQERLLYLEHA